MIKLLMAYYGGHVSVAGGLKNAIDNAQKLGMTAIQIHPTAPQRWVNKMPSQDEISAFVTAQKESSVKVMFMHAIYLINLAQPDKQKFHLSKMAVVNYLKLQEQIENEVKKQKSDLIVGGVVIHTGSAKFFPTEIEALERAIYGINWIFENAPKGTLILEMSAGAGAVIGDTFSDLEYIRSKVEQLDRLKIGLDTQHMWASGYDWVNNLDNIVAEANKAFDIDNISIIHLNDSKQPLGSKKDRHENLGAGLIGLDAMESIVTHKQLRKIPFILETPAMTSGDIVLAKSQVDYLKTWLE